MSYSLNSGKELAQAPRTVVFCDFLFADGSTYRAATIPATFNGNTYEARIVEPDVAQLAQLAESGVDRIPSATITIADPEGTILTNWERAAGRGFKGARLTLTLALLYVSTGEFSTDSLTPFVGICDVPGVDEKHLTVTANSKMNLSLIQLPPVLLQPRCPWNNPVTEAQRAQAGNRNSCFYRCGETRDLGTAPPCAYTRETCTQPNRFCGITYRPPEGGEGVSYLSGKIQWRNVDTRSKSGARWPLWLGGKCWLEVPLIVGYADGNYMTGEMAVGVDRINVEKVILNGKELTYSADSTGDFVWWYINQGNRDGVIGHDGQGDPYGSMTVIGVKTLHAYWSPDSMPQVRVLGRPESLRVYRRIVSAVGTGGNIVVTFDGANEDCAGNPPFTVTIEGNTFANGTHELVSWAWGPPGTITLATTGTGSQTGGWCYYEGSGSVGGASGVSTPWALMRALWWSRLEYSDLDVLSFADVAKICNQTLHFDGVPDAPRFSTAIAILEPVQASEFIRGIRQSIGAILVPTADGKIKLQLEGTLAEQQPAPVDGSNYNTPGASHLRDGTDANGYAAYHFDESNSWGWRRLPRAVAQMPNRVSVSFVDPVQGFAVSNLSLADSDDMARVDHEQPGGLQVKPEGIASQNQALRCEKTGLAKIHRGHPNGANDTRGTEWFEWQTSFRGCRLTVGQIPITDQDRLGLANQMLRITAIKPSRNFETLTITGHWHSDSWYLDSLGNSADPSQLGEDVPPFPWDQKLSVPGNVQAIGADAFLLTKTEDGKTATLTATYDPPASIEPFAGVTAHLQDPDGSASIALSSDYLFNGNRAAAAGTPERRGTLVIQVPQSMAGAKTVRVYLTPYSWTGYHVPLVMHGYPGESPSVTIAITQATTTSAMPPADMAPTAVKVNAYRIEGGKRKVDLAITGTPPAPLGTFAGIHVYAEVPDGSDPAHPRKGLGEWTLGTDALSTEFQPIDCGKFPHRAADIYRAVLALDEPPAPVIIRLYCVSFSSEIENALIAADKPGASPSITFVLTPRPSGISGEEYADPISGFSVRVEQRLEGGTWKTYIYPTFTWPGDPRISGVVIDVMWLDPAQNKWIPYNGGVFGRQLKADGTTPSNWFDTPATVQTMKVVARSYSDPSGTPTTADDQVNTYVPGVTPEVSVSIGKADGVLNLAKATAGTLNAAAFAATILPPEIVSTLPTLPDANYPTGRLVVLTTDSKLYRSTGAAWTKAVDGADITANSITAGKITAGAIGTSQLFAGEILVGQGGGKPSRLTVVDINGTPIAFLGSDASGNFNWFKDVRIGPNINAPTIYGSGSGVTINGASFTLSLNGLITSISNSVDASGTSGLALAMTANSAKNALYGDMTLMNNNAGTRTVQICSDQASAGGGTGYSHIMLRDTAGSNRISLDSANGGVLSIQGIMRVHINGFSDYYGNQVVTDRQAAVANPTGGTVVDTECRAALATLLSRLRTHGLIAT